MRVALNGLRFVVVVAEDRLHLQGLRLLRHRRAGPVMHHQQPGVVDSVRLGQCLQCGVELGQRLHDEINPPVCARQRVENLAVQHEKAENLSAGAQGVVQGGVVVRPQVAAEPDQSALVLFAHGEDVSWTAALESGPDHGSSA